MHYKKKRTNVACFVFLCEFNVKLMRILHLDQKGHVGLTTRTYCFTMLEQYRAALLVHQYIYSHVLNRCGRITVQTCLLRTTMIARYTFG